MNTKPHICFYFAHDFAITIYEPDKNIVHVLKADTVEDKKHCEGISGIFLRTNMQALGMSRVDDVKNIEDGYLDVDYNPVYLEKQHFGFAENVPQNIEKIHQYIKKGFGIDNDYDKVYVGFANSMSGYGIQDWSTLAKGNEYILNNIPLNHQGKIDVALHHDCHAYNAYWQSPFCKSDRPVAAITWDGGGDWQAFNFYVIDKKGSILKNVNFPFNFGSIYAYLSSEYFPGILSKGTHPLDNAGKLMGYSAYGKRFEETHSQEITNALNLWKKMCMFFENAEPTYNTHDFQSFKDFNFRTLAQKYRTNKNTAWSRRREYFEGMLPRWFSRTSPIPHELEGDTAEFTAWVIQKTLQESMLTLIRNVFKTDIERCDNNLLMSGGCALNVLVNEEIKKEFPEINVWVSPNPADDGLGMGLLYHYNKDQITEPVKVQGPDIIDLDELDNYNPVLSSQDEILDYISEGKIVGLIQGKMEVGPRALGFRSILCDPSISDMKDTLNEKVKFREWYRPFAPVCRLEDASTYFESPYFENMEAMSFVVDVKKPFRRAFPAITHIDNTARLQTVTEKSNKFFYELLTKWDGVLLNTSFNVQGKPILNSIKHAHKVLTDTGLDAFFVVKDGEVYKIEQVAV